MTHPTFERNPRDGANFLSVMLLWWMNGLLTLGNKRTLNEDDLFPVLEDCKAELLLSMAEKNWFNEKEQCLLNCRKPRLWKAILRMVPFKVYLLIAVLKLLQSVTFVSLPVCLWLVLKTLNDGQNTSAFSYVALLGITGVVKAFSFQHYDYITEVWGLRLKVATIGLVYKRIISLNRQHLEETLSGNAINLVSNDAQKLERSLNQLGLALSSPLEISSEMFILWYLIGWQALVGAGLFFLIVILSVLMVSKAAKLTKKAAEITDKRLGVMKEIITGIRALKLHAWEFNYRDIVTNLRRKEMKIFRQKGIIFSGFTVLSFVTLSLSMLISITALVLSGITLTSFTVFSLLSGLTVLRFVFCISLGRCVLIVADVKVALDRIQSFLMDEESKLEDTKEMVRQNKTSQPLADQNIKANRTKQDQVTTELDISPNNSRLNWSYTQPLIAVDEMSLDTMKYPVSATTERVESGKTKTNHPARYEIYLSIADASCSWTTGSGKQTVCEVSLDAPKSHMVAIIGPVGSGKSSLLMAVLGELPLSKGNISFHGKIAFVPQIPWIFSGTVRENILFGLPYNEAKFQHVVDTCNLRKDLADFSIGDQTEIGQRGVNLSGGQKARVSLARALYSEADIYLLDDPLSALDAKVGRKLFETCILGTLSDSIRLLVTHQLQYLKDIDHIIVMENGSIKLQGGYSELKNSTLFSRILELSAMEDEAVACKSLCEENVTREDRSPTTLSWTPSHMSDSLELSESPPLDLREEEERKTAGTVSWRVYWKYFREGLPAVLIVLLVILLLVSQVCVLAPNWWLARITNMVPDQQRYRMELVIYACLVAISLIVAIGVYYFFYYTVLKASENLHNKMAMAIIKAPVLFFDKNPAGRILNRFSKDLGCMDDVLPPQFQLAVLLCLNTVSSILVPVATNYWLFLVLLPIIALFVYFVRYYVKTSRELKRIEAIRCSPVYSHIAETLTGLEVVHCSNMQSAFLDRMNRYQDDNTQAFFLVLSSARWLGIRLDLLSSLFVTTVGIGAVLVANNPAFAGLALTYALQTIDDTQYGLRLASEVENLMTSVERVITYTKIDSEPGYSTEAIPPENWPTEGALEVQNLFLEYIEGGPRVLKDINVCVPCKQKVGVVGRTGAGKSSLVSAMFRMPEPSGKVFVDGLDIGGLNLQAARKSMAVITQDPVIFSGSVRRNLDPFSKYTEEELWIALEEVQLKHVVQNMPGQLEFQLKEGGTNFSVGERQLVCLARALLERSKIIIMDEATANVDLKTDRLIQEVIRNKFRDSTVLTIAHRLNTVIDYDKVLVLDGGRVVEFDKPEILLSKANGFFAELFRSHVQS